LKENKIKVSKSGNVIIKATLSDLAEGFPTGERKQTADALAGDAAEYFDNDYQQDIESILSDIDEENNNFIFEYLNRMEPDWEEIYEYDGDHSDLAKVIKELASDLVYPIQSAANYATNKKSSKTVYDAYWKEVNDKLGIPKFKTEERTTLDGKKYLKDVYIFKKKPIEIPGVIFSSSKNLSLSDMFEEYIERTGESYFEKIDFYGLSDNSYTDEDLNDEIKNSFSEINLPKPKDVRIREKQWASEKEAGQEEFDIDPKSYVKLEGFRRLRELSGLTE
jgi:hypothetical protein